MLHCIAYYLVLMQAKFTTLTQVTASRLMPRTSSRSKTSRNLTLHTQDVLLKCESLRLHLVDLLDLRPRQHFYCFDRSDHGAFGNDFPTLTFIFSDCLVRHLTLILGLPTLAHPIDHSRPQHGTNLRQHIGDRSTPPLLET